MTEPILDALARAAMDRHGADGVVVVTFGHHVGRHAAQTGVVVANRKTMRGIARRSWSVSRAAEALARDLGVTR